MNSINPDITKQILKQYVSNQGDIQSTLNHNQLIAYPTKINIINWLQEILLNNQTMPKIQQKNIIQLIDQIKYIIPNITPTKRNLTQNIIEAWTDGSKTENNITSAWIVKENNKITDFSFQGYGPLTSYQAELLAIESILKSYPNSKSIIIYTDSLASITAIQNFRSWSRSRWLKDSSYPTLLSIKQQPNLNRTKFNHVYSHLDDLSQQNKQKLKIMQNLYKNWKEIVKLNIKVDELCTKQNHNS